MDFKSLLAAKAAKRKKKKAEIIDGKKVVSKTTIRVRSKEKVGVMEKFTEYIFEDGSSKRIPLGEAAKPQYVKDQEDGIYALPIFQWNKNKWKATQQAPQGKQKKSGKAQKKSETKKLSTVGKPSESTLPQKLTFVTYNVWFSTRNQDARAKELLKIVTDLNADVICLQEVTPVFLDHLKADSMIQKNYSISDATGTTLRGRKLAYGVVMCVAKTIALTHWALHVVPSVMNRRPLIARFGVNEKEMITVVTTHLESMRNVATRKQQLEHIFKLIEDQNHVGKLLDDDHHCFVMGDFNFDLDAKKSDEKNAIPREYKDAWRIVHPHKSKKDSVTVMDIQSRIDQVHYKSTKYGPVEMKRIGVLPIEGLNTNPPAKNAAGISMTGHSIIGSMEYPSDHYGLCAVFELEMI
uniref:Endonuclease/exonuclease/phosphatase domain-containing protein n=1 Tax=Lotharella oceanica TaxID=641309 RepID=A0A7S2XH71_9EUKA|mmetsp:Transcript_8192/g.16108  ORF Transcript_8192/g.16108 Transcript_8192/m.16108 type:complete len:408 (+) Transcript_8192:73-1296(+)